MNGYIEPDLLKSFVAIVEAGSFTDAARRVHRTQSAVSMQIKRLEEMLGRPVFIRDGRAISLTRDGEVLLGHAHRILQAHQEAAAAFRPSELEGTVTIGAREEDATSYLPTILGRFAETHPLVHVNVVCDMTYSLNRRMAEGELDFAIVMHCVDNDGGIVLVREPVVWVTSAYHCPHEQDPVPFAAFGPECSFRRQAIEALSRQGRAYRIAYTSVSLAGIRAAVDAGLAISVMQHSNVTEGLRILDDKDGFPPLPPCQIALKRSGAATAPLHDRLEEYILESFRPARAVAMAG